MGHDTEPDEGTRAAEKIDAAHEHTADRLPTSEEETDAEAEYAATDADERADVAEHYEKMNKLGANVKGEGEIK